MKKLLFLLFAFLAFAILFVCFGKKEPAYLLPLSTTAFDTSIGLNTLGASFILEKPLDQELVTLSHQLIEKRKGEWERAHTSEEAEHVHNSSRNIPQHIHQIWVEEGDLPDAFARGVQSVKAFHPDVPYTLWTPKEYEPLLSSSLGETWKTLPKSILRDVVAATILLQYGGVVLDGEIECVQSLLPLLSLPADCLLSFSPPLQHPLFNRRLLLSPLFVAATPSHGLVRAWLEEMLQRASSEQETDNFPAWATEEALTSIAALRAERNGSVLFLGPTYFCPINPAEIKEFQQIVEGTAHQSLKKKILYTLRLSSPPPYSQITYETYGIHMEGGRKKETIR